MWSWVLWVTKTTRWRDHNLPEGSQILQLGTCERSLQEIETFISGVEMDVLRTLCARLLEGQGGVSLARAMLNAVPKRQQPQPSPRSPDWCICGHCRSMPSPIANICCARRNCITLYDTFHLLCLHPTVLRVAIRNNCDWRADPVVYNHTNFRKAGYRHYVLWVYGRLGRGNRRVAPSCIVLRVRSRFPSSDGTYMGFKEV